jgi:hypothetical protein
MLKADDLLAMDSSDPRESTTTTSVFLRPAEIRRPTAISSASKYVFQIFLFWLWKCLECFRERSTKPSLDKIKRELITTTTTEDGKRRMKHLITKQDFLFI